MSTLRLLANGHLRLSDSSTLRLSIGTFPPNPGFQPDGSFDFTILFVPHTLARAGDVDSAFDFVSTLGLSATMTLNGLAAMTANLNMGSFVISDLHNGTSPTHLAAVGQLPNSNHGPMIVSALVAPSTSAAFVGQIYVDTFAKNCYIAASVGSGPSDWQKLN